MTDVAQQLIIRSQAGDVEAFETLIKQHQVIAYNIAYRILGDQEDAKDAAQEALIKVFKNLPGFKAESQFSTWLYRIVVNTCTDYMRKHRKITTVSTDKGLETEEGTLQTELPDERMAPEVVFEQTELKQKVQAAISALPEQNRTVIVLRDVQGMSYDVIASMLDLPVGTVKSRINRGRDMLKKLLIESRINAYGLTQ